MRCVWNGVFYVPNLASLVPKSIWPGTEGKRLKGRSTLTIASFTVPRPAFHRLQYGKAGTRRAWYISSREGRQGQKGVERPEGGVGIRGSQNSKKSEGTR